MQVGSELLQGFLLPRGGQVEADKLQGGVILQQHLTLDVRPSLLAGIVSSERKSSCRVVVVSVTGVLGSCREGDDTTPAGRGEAAKGWSARAMGPETGDGGTNSQKATLAGKAIMGIKKVIRHTARNKDCIGDSESGPEWPGRGLWTTQRALTRPAAAGLLLLVSLAVASGVMGLEFSGDCGHEQPEWAELDTGSSGWSARGWLWAAKER